MAGYKTCYKTFHRSCKNLGWQPARRTLTKHVLPIRKGEHARKRGDQRAQVAETVGTMAPTVQDDVIMTTSIFFKELHKSMELSSFHCSRFDS